MHRSALASFLRALGLALVFTTLAAPALAGPARQQPGGPVYRIEVAGTLTSVTAGYVRRAIQEAEAAGAQALVITLGGGGGVLDDTRPLADDLSRARVPVVVYVAPSGTASGAPGALLLSAAHVSAMAPGTSFGSAAPLAQADTALTDQSRAMIYDSVASQLREWNEARGRDASWVDRAVREGAILTNEQAVASSPPAVDMVAASHDELLTLLEGRTVRLADGSAVRLATLGRAATPIEPTAFESLRLALADPTVAFALLILGAIAIYLELASPGIGAFAAIGLALLLAAGAGLVALPLRWWAIGLLLLALVLIGAEFVVHSHGGLTVAGLALLVVGALNMVDQRQAPGAGVALWAVGAVAAGVAGTVAAGLGLALRARARPAALGPSSLVGRLAEVRSRLDPRGMVFVDGALWQAISETGPAEPGDWVRVSGVHNLQLIVRPIDDEDPSPPSA